MNYNKVILAGTLTREPELSYTPINTPMCKFGIAINRKYKDKEEVCFVDVTAWAKTAEFINEYFEKGKPIFIEGRLNYQAWETKDGQKRTKLDVIADHAGFCGGGSGRKGGKDKGEPGQPAGAASRQRASREQDGAGIPF